MLAEEFFNLLIPASHGHICLIWSFLIPALKNIGGNRTSFFQNTLQILQSKVVCDHGERKRDIDRD